MKKTLLVALMLILSIGSICAQSSMTDDQVIKFVIKEQKAGSSQQQIVTKLVQKGVDIDQIRRVRKKYDRMNKGDGLGTVDKRNTAFGRQCHSHSFAGNRLHDSGSQRDIQR